MPEVLNPFAADDAGTVYDRGRPYHHPRSLAHIRALVGDAPIGRALDVACGTGMSTVALAEYARVVIGVDRSREMLRAARHAQNAHYVYAAAEQMPVPAGAFDAVTCCSGVHWFDQPRFFGELHRVLAPNGWVGLYDHYFFGKMIDVPEFKQWTREALTRFPLPPRAPQVGDPRSETPPGFEHIGDEFFDDDIAMTPDEFADYQLTISNFVSAAAAGTDPAELRAWLIDSTAPLFAGHATRTVRFLGSITCLRRNSS
jgi:SAM-dependent methyltransferase